MSERAVESFDLELILLQNVIDVHVIAVVLSEVNTVHEPGIRVDVVFQKLLDCIFNVLDFMRLQISEVCCSNEELEELISTDVTLSRLFVLVLTHIGCD